MVRSRRRKIFIAVIAVSLGAAAGAMQIGSALSSSDDREVEPNELDTASAARFPVFINLPKGPPRVDTGLVDDSGEAVTAACSTCHATREPNPANVSASDLDTFHQGLTFVHGSLTCLSCHNPNDYDQLRFADGTGLPYPQVMELCAQCHGKRARDYEHGAHGGMTGYWDLTRGPRHRNGCIDCHDAHAPAFPSMMPTFKPIDRFLTPNRTHDPRGEAERHE